jgi:hypothetical protein
MAGAIRDRKAGNPQSEIDNPRTIFDAQNVRIAVLGRSVN